MTRGNQQRSRTLASRNGAIEVREYVAPYGDHEGHRRLLSLIDEKWLSEAAWQKRAEEKLNMRRCTFYSTKKELERCGCVAQFGRHYSAILVQIPWPHFNLLAENKHARPGPVAVVQE